MTKRSASTPAVPAIDPRSDVVVLRYLGGTGLPLGVPARDLTGGDLFRIARVRAVHEAHGEHADVAAGALEALAEDLAQSGAFETATTEAD